MMEHKQLGIKFDSPIGASIRIKKQKRILLIEPAYKAKYPPLGLMKISTYHKRQENEAVFYKGTNVELRDQK